MTKEELQQLQESAIRALVNTKPYSIAELRKDLAKQFQCEESEITIKVRGDRYISATIPVNDFERLKVKLP